MGWQPKTQPKGKPPADRSAAKRLLIKGVKMPDTKKDFADFFCLYCNNDWYCPEPCWFIEKINKTSVLKLKDAYIRYEGDVQTMATHIKQWK